MAGFYQQSACGRRTIPVKGEKVKTILSIILLIGFIAAFVIGTGNEWKSDIIFRKASSICLQCIGIG